jgi:hypothetical protein
MLYKLTMLCTLQATNNALQAHADTAVSDDDDESVSSIESTAAVTGNGDMPAVWPTPAHLVLLQPSLYFAAAPTPAANSAAAAAVPAAATGCAFSSINGAAIVVSRGVDTSAGCLPMQLLKVCYNSKHHKIWSRLSTKQKCCGVLRACWFWQLLHKLYSRYC